MTSALAYADLVKQKRKLEAELKQLNELIWQEEQALLEQFATEGVRAKRLEDGRVVSIRRQIWARAVDGDKQRTAQALRGTDLGSFVEETFNTHSLSAFFRRMLKDAEEEGVLATLDDLIPESAKPYIALTEDYKLGVTSGN